MVHRQHNFIPYDEVGRLGEFALQGDVIGAHTWSYFPRSSPRP